jgi:hypothetical protein
MIKDGIEKIDLELVVNYINESIPNYREEIDRVLDPEIIGYGPVADFPCYDCGEEYMVNMENVPTRTWRMYSV